MICVQLTAEQERELSRLKRQAPGRVAIRAHMVLLSARGYPVPEIARIHGCGCDVVRHWLHQYQRRGAAGLRDEPRSGRPPKDPLAARIVDTQASQPPDCSGHVQTRWTAPLLAAFLAVRFHLQLSAASVRRYLRNMDWRWARPRLAPASVLPSKRDPEADEKRQRIGRALRQARRGLLHLLFLDECDLALLPVIRAMWMKGERLRIPTPGTNVRHAFFGALEALNGALHWADFERKLAVNFVAFLQQLAAAYPTGRVALAMDCVRMHDAKVVRKWLAANPRFEVLWLPKYAAHEENPIERIWGLLKDAVAANRLARCMDELVRSARRKLCDLALARPVVVRTAA